MNNSQVAHIWAQQTKESGKGSNFFFNGPTIYSYGLHFPIATFTDKFDANGEKIVLFTSRGYSMTTNGKHIPKARMALHGLPVRVFCVPNLEPDHAENSAHYVSEYNAAILAASRSRKYGTENTDRAEQLRADCADYCAIFGQSFPTELEAEISPELLATAKARADKARTEDKARKANQAELLRIKMIERAQKWRNGDNVDLWGHPDTMLRLSANGRSVETSRGASVPVFDARALWQMVAACQRAAQVLDTPPPVAVGEFQLRSIDTFGNAQVGCHRIMFDESRAFATAQGWTV